MGYTIKDFLESNQFPNVHLISDDSNITQEIKGVQIVEVPEIEKYLKSINEKLQSKKESSVENSTLRSYHSIKNR